MEMIISTRRFFPFRKLTELYFFILLVLCGGTNVYAQSSFSTSLPETLPPTPEVSALIKAGVGVANLSTGAATASIPLYTIKVRDFSFPISLSYSTQGLKADEASSRVGYGWALIANGAISRSVRGEPDEFSQRMTVPADLTANTQQVFDYLQAVSNSGSGYDSQPDEFQFNFNGYSGKFVLDNNYQVRFTDTNNYLATCAITVSPGSTGGNIGGFTITTPDGVKYSFGMNYEITTDVASMKFSVYKLVTKTAFFLDRIDLPSGENIIFNYGPISMTVPTGINQELSLPTGNSGVENCGNCSSYNKYTTTYDKVSYNSKYLTSIVVSNGLNINFTYEARPDNTGDNRLAQVDVVGVKKYAFGYYNSSGGQLGRFFLTKITDVPLGVSPLVPLDYVLDYDNLSSVPAPITFAQDYLGFSNASTAGYFIPPFETNGTINFNHRNPNAGAAMKGTLTSITFPTGGREEFFYEANTRDELQLRENPSAFYTLAENGGTTGPITYTIPMNIAVGQTVTFNAYADDAILNDGLTADPAEHTVVAEILQGTTVIKTLTVFGYTPVSASVALSGGLYTLKMKVNSHREIGSATVFYLVDPTPIYDHVNVVIPGVRLRQIRYTDPYRNSMYSKYYTYETLSAPGISTGSCNAPVFLSSMNMKKNCGDFGAFQTVCNVRAYSSNSTNSVYNIAGSGGVIYYTTMIESDDPGYAHGGTEYTFYPNESGSRWGAIRGDGIPYLPAGQSPELSGRLFKKKVFDSGKNIISEERTDYERMSYGSGAPITIYVRKKYEPWPGNVDQFEAFDVVRADYWNYWLREKTVTVTGPAVVGSKTDFTYGDPLNVLPWKTTVTDSKNSQIVTEMQYANTYTGSDLSSVRGLLHIRNILTAPLLVTATRDGVLQQQKKTFYEDWQIKKIQVQESPADILHDDLIFSMFDNTGNFQQVQKVNDVPITYLWDKTLVLPMCQIKNAASIETAYTSFENSSNGNWTIVAGSVSSASALTGSKSLTGATCTVQMSFEAAYQGKIKVTAWTTGTPSTIGSVSATLVDNSRSDGWKLYEWILTNPALTVDVTSTTALDEVRLAPERAQFQSLIYKPFIGLLQGNDPNNRLTYYDYDGFGRLIMIRDDKSQVIKAFDYFYDQPGN